MLLDISFYNLKKKKMNRFRDMLCRQSTQTNSSTDPDTKHKSSKTYKTIENCEIRKKDFSPQK